MTLIRPSGGYRTLRSFRTATIIYDATVSFCERFIDSKSRTVDQMVQAARSGRQNIAEGSRASGTSSQTELRLVNVARASLDELLLDYEDYLRQHHVEQWDKNHKYAIAVRNIGKTMPDYSLKNQSDRTDKADLAITIPREDYQHYASWLEHIDPAIIANTAICLIHQTNYLLDRQISELERQFVEEGGYSEKLATKRLEYRQLSLNRSDLPDRSDQRTIPLCTNCGSLMVLRTAHQGKHNGEQFWGCSKYPTCKGISQLDE